MDNTQERIEGPTPNGGAYAIMYFMDDNGDPCAEDRAARAEIVEYDQDGNGIFRTYGSFNKG